MTNESTNIILTIVISLLALTQLAVLMVVFLVLRHVRRIVSDIREATDYGNETLRMARDRMSSAAPLFSVGWYLVKRLRNFKERKHA